MSELPITFQPSGRTIFVLPGTPVLEAAAQAGLAVQTPCGGRGTCRKCRVRFVSEPPPPADADREAFDPSQLADGWRLACRHTLAAPARLFVPPESVYGTAEQILTGDRKVKIEIRPAVRRKFVRLDPPTMDDPGDDLTRLREALREPDTTIPPPLGGRAGERGPLADDLKPPVSHEGGSLALTSPPLPLAPSPRRDLDIATSLLRQLPRLLRDSNWAVTATLANGRIIDLAGGESRAAPLGAAFDIGTTTVVGTLMDLATGAELAVAARINPQTAFGDDVISRIQLAREQPDGLARLHGAIIEAIGAMLVELAAEAGVEAAEICELTVAGNTTMQLLFAGVWPGPLGEIPFAAGFCAPLVLDASDFRLPMHPRGRVYILPSIGAFLGGDTVAGILATDLEDLPGHSLLIDIGTNGEIVLASNGRLWAASTAAGPAFEGARIRMGMRAAAGAIEKVIIDHDVQVNVIGNVPAVGLCGTAVIDAAAGLLNAGLVDTTGRLLGDDELPADLPAALRRRVCGRGAGAMFMLTADVAQPPSAVAGREAAGFPVFDGDTPEGGCATSSGPSNAHPARQSVVLTQRDIRELQLASGAIRAGAGILLERAGLRADQLDAVFLAGAFGNYIRRENARRIGLLPDVPIERIHFVGNAASMGAKLALMSTSARDEAAAIARAIQRVDLSADLNFQMKFADAMIFPE